MIKKYVNIKFYQDTNYTKLSEKVYTYINTYGLNLKVGDDVVVPVNRNSEYMRHGVGKVCNVFDEKRYNELSPCPKELLIPVISKCNVSYIGEQHHKRERFKELSEKLEKEFNKKSKMLMYKKMSEDDPELSKMYEELQALSQDINTEEE